MRLARALDAVAALIAAALCGYACRNGTVVAPAFIAALASLALRDGVRADRFAQIAASLVLGALPAYFATNVLDRQPPFGVLEPAPGALAVALLGAAAMRPIFALRGRSGIANSALLGLALVGVGQSKLGLLYAAVAALCATLSLAARAIEQRPSQPTFKTHKRDVVALASVALVGAALTLLGGWSLPLAHRWSVNRYFERYARSQTESGLSDHMALGAMDGVLQSDTIVLRLRGRRTDYLRGVVFDRYRLGSWSYSGNANRRTMPIEQRADGMRADETEVRPVSGPTGWALLPLETAHVASPEGALEVFPSGVMRTGTDRNPLWFRTGEPRAVTPDAPNAFDREVPRVMRNIFTVLTVRWGCDRGSPSERMRCLEDRLRRDYLYSLRVPESRRTDPIVAFLLQFRRGHCEYFASALALLGRAAGVPTRVVVGYRVTEHSEWGDYDVVRERNAHSWVEAYTEGSQWVRYDATPASAEELYRGRSIPRWRTFIESLRWRAIDLFDRFRARGGLKWFIGALSIVLIGSVVQRTLRARSQRAPSVADSEPTEALRRLLDRLSREGLERRPSETLERLAQRVLESALEPRLARSVADALTRYADVRYGSDASDAVDQADAQLARATIALDGKNRS